MRDKYGQMYYIEDESKGCIPDRGNEIYLRPLIEKIKKEITEHADKEIQKMKRRSRLMRMNGMLELTVTLNV